MLVVGQKTVGNQNVTLYKWNGKYILKLEQPMLEQTYKWSEMDVTGEAEVWGILQNADFIKRVEARFEEMAADLAILY